MGKEDEQHGQGRRAESKRRKNDCDDHGRKVSFDDRKEKTLISKGCKLVGCGSAVPNRQISNHDLAQIIDTSDEWISSRTGIRNRRILTGKETLTGLAVEAAQKSLQMAELEPDDVDLILNCSSTPESLFGGAAEVQKTLGCKRNPPAYDIRSACSGFILGLVSASCHIRGGEFQESACGIGQLIVYLRYVDWTEEDSVFSSGMLRACDMRRMVCLVLTCIRMEMAAVHNCIENPPSYRYVGAHMRRNETSHFTGGSSLGFFPSHTSISHIQMNGQEVFRFVVKVAPQTIEASLANAGLRLSEIDCYGNTSAASIPLALDEAVRSGNVKEGETIMTVGFGAGLTWGSAIIISGLLRSRNELEEIFAMVEEKRLKEVAFLVDVLSRPSLVLPAIFAGKDDFLYYAEVVSLYVLVIGADCISRYVDWTDRKTCVLFGDAAGAILVQAYDIEEDGLFGFDMHTDGDGSRYVGAHMKRNETSHVTGGSSLGFFPSHTSISHIQMNGQEVFRFVVKVVPQTIEASLANAGLRLSEIDWLLVHQFPKDRVISNLENYGNTSAASIPLALDEAVQSGDVKEGDTIMTVGFGAGLTWGSTIVRWC
ncbi:3-oxoacyl-[acyl-carrier-protein] synthase 3 A, chloroplastic-like protein [Tanacetum coccineum]